MENSLSNVQIVPIRPNNGLVGFASFVFENSIFCGSIGIYTRPQGGYRLTYPTRKKVGGNINIYYPINREVAGTIEEIIIPKFEKLSGLVDQNERYKLNPMSSEEYEDWSNK